MRGKGRWGREKKGRKGGRDEEKRRRGDEANLHDVME